MHVLVTGAGGFVGESVARACLAKSWRVSAVYRNRKPKRLLGASGLELVRADLLEGEGLPARYDALVHCAAEVPATCPDPETLLRTNVESTRRIFAHAASAGAQRIVYMSSMAVYGTISVPTVNEETEPVSPGVYGRSKAAGEDELRLWTSGGAHRAGVAIRLPGVVGAGGRNNFLCDTLARILAGEPVTAKNPQALFNNVVHLTDLSAFVADALPRLTAGVSAVTLGAVEPLTIRDVLSLLFAGSGKPLRIEWGEGGGKPFLISFERARLLGYRPATVADSVSRFVADVLRERAQA